MSRAAPGSAPAISYDNAAEASRYLGIEVPADARAFFLNGEVHIIADMIGDKQELVEAWVCMAAPNVLAVLIMALDGWVRA